MNISNNISSMQSYQSITNNSSSDIARNKTDLPKEISNQITSKHSTSSDSNVIKTQNEMLGSMLDIKA